MRKLAAVRGTLTRQLVTRPSSVRLTSSNKVEASLLGAGVVAHLTLDRRGVVGVEILRDDKPIYREVFVPLMEIAPPGVS